MTMCFVLLRLFFPGALAQPMIDQSNVTLLAMGKHTDQLTGNYYNVFVNETSLSERSWYDCNYPGGGIRLACCGTAHGIGNFVSSVGSGTASGYIIALLKEINDGRRLDQKPRSVCITRDSSNLCVSWATYATSKMTSAEETEISRFSKECGLKGYGAEFKTALTNGNILYVCVSNRAKGCG
ncbi:hypothetical protein N7445_001027 [Penicillium cf. griseofulvum]|nr:hypothetical protein N7445_001027 [Penicillium cf. griseofulvum]